MNINLLFDARKFEIHDSRSLSCKWSTEIRQVLLKSSIRKLENTTVPKLDYSSQNTVVSDKSKAILDSITIPSMQSEHENKDGGTRGLLEPSEPYWSIPTAFFIKGPGVNQ